MKKDEKTPEESTPSRPQSWIEQEIFNSLESLKQSFAATEQRTAEIKILKGNYISLEKRQAESENRQLTLEETVRVQKDRILHLETRQKALEAEIATMGTGLESTCGSLKNLADELRNGSV